MTLGQKLPLQNLEKIEHTRPTKLPILREVVQLRSINDRQMDRPLTKKAEAVLTSLVYWGSIVS